MRGGRVGAGIAAGLMTLSLGSGAARAGFVYYASSGIVRPAPGATENPWELELLGTPFTLQVLVDAEAADLDGTQNPGYAEFTPALVILEIDGQRAVVSSAKVVFGDDEFSGLFDSISFQIQATRLGTSLLFFSGTRTSASTFALASPAAPDLPPIFADALPVQFGGTTAGIISTSPADAPVTGRAEDCPGPPPVSWTSPTTGSSDGIEIELLGLTSAAYTDLGFQEAAFSAGKLCSTARAISYDTGSDWTAVLSPPAGFLLLYARAWRGTAAGAAPAVYQFDRPFTILSGLAEAIVSEDGTRLTLPDAGFHDGILRFEGPIESVSVDTSSTSASDQAMTFVVPEPQAGAAAAVAAFGLLARRRRRRSAESGSNGGSLVLVARPAAVDPVCAASPRARCRR